MQLIVRLLSLIPFYLIGAFPTGRLIAKFHDVNIEDHGSGNVGATNLARTLGKKAGLYTLLGDVGKGFIAVLIARLISGDAWFAGWAGLAVVSGHCFSIPGKMKGGKGVATALGALLMLEPLSVLCGLGVFIIVAAASKIVSLSSVLAALFVPIIAMFNGEPDAVIFPTTAIALLVTYRHKENLKRIVEGREKKFSFGG